jgi:hypothetical protein
MAQKVIKINTHLPVIPDWLKISKSINFKIPLKTAKELAAKLAEVKEDVEVEINFATGKEVGVEFRYEAKEPEQSTETEKV